MLCQRLEELRGNYKLSKREVAVRLGVAESTYGKWELGQRRPDLDKLAALAALFGVSTDYLLGRTNDPAPSGAKKEPPPAQAGEALRVFVEHKLGRPADEQELSLVEAAADGLIERLKQRRA